jgi:hypothetical protein
MKRSLLATVALVVGAAILAVGLVGARLIQTGPQEVAHAVGTFAFAIDANPWNDDYPCDSIDAANSVNVGDDHQVAVCTVNEPETAPGVKDDVNAFSFHLTYNPLLNQCKTNPSCPGEPAGKCLDDNPDANAGSTLGTGHSPTSPDLGTGWDCSGLGTTQPTCSGGAATLNCLSVNGPYTSGGLSPFPLAVVMFHVLAGGTDTIDTTGTVWGGVETGEGFPVSVSAAVEKVGQAPAPTATQTATPTATATATPCPGGVCPPTPRAWTKTPTPMPTETPKPAEPSGPAAPPPPPPPTGEQLPQVVPPATGSGPDGTPWAGTAVWLLAAAGAVSVSLGGLYFRRARHR